MVRLASGYMMPLVGLGTWKAPAGVTAAGVEVAIKADQMEVHSDDWYRFLSGNRRTLLQQLARSVSGPTVP